MPRLAIASLHIVNTMAGPQASPPRGKTRRPLSTWDQASIRAYINLALCFGFDNSRAEEATKSIQSCLDRMAQRRPDFSGRLQLGAISGRPAQELFLHESADNQIPLHVSHSEVDFGVAYDEMKTRGFPASCFIHPRFAHDASIQEGQSVPVARVVVIFIPGGLLLSVVLHHVIFDGDCMRLFLENFAALSRGEDGLAMPESLEAPIPPPRTKNMAQGQSVHALISSFPEYEMQPDASGPNTSVLAPGGIPPSNIAKTGKVFVFAKEKLCELQSRLRAQMGPLSPKPSTLLCLSALSWSRIANARYSVEKYMSDQPPSKNAKLIIPIDWKKRAFQDEPWARDYFGNATTSPITTISTSELIQASQQSYTGMAHLALRIQQTIDSVDDEFISQRNAMYSAVEDPRLIGIDIELREPLNLMVNTWRFAGADTRWDIPGLVNETPDAIRRAQGQWNMARVLILPSKESSGKQEVLVTLSVDSMEVLCEDSEWLRWVDRVID
jgi:hypothetical protein